ncbi:MAG: hypothetical protein Q7R84_01530, partial [bacterium]|nr:hypothetical protein [bacterium]
FIEKDEISETRPVINSQTNKSILELAPAPVSTSKKSSSDSSAPASVSVTCTDSDGGFNLYKKGVVVATAGVLTESKTDYCNNKDVFEYYCTGSDYKPVAIITSSKGDINLSGEWETCPNGCSDGACLTQ